MGILIIGFIGLLVYVSFRYGYISGFRGKKLNNKKINILCVLCLLFLFFMLVFMGEIGEERLSYFFGLLILLLITLAPVCYVSAFLGNKKGYMKHECDAGISDNNKNPLN